MMTTEQFNEALVLMDAKFKIYDVPNHSREFLKSELFLEASLILTEDQGQELIAMLGESLVGAARYMGKQKNKVEESE